MEGSWFILYRQLVPQFIVEGAEKDALQSRLIPPALRGKRAEPDGELRNRTGTLAKVEQAAGGLVSSDGLVEDALHLLSERRQRGAERRLMIPDGRRPSRRSAGEEADDVRHSGFFRSIGEWLQRKYEAALQQEAGACPEFPIVTFRSGEVRLSWVRRGISGADLWRRTRRSGR